MRGMHRRRVLATLALLPVLARAQSRPAAVPRVAIVMFGAPASIRQRVDAFRAAMKALGYDEGRDVRYDVHAANGQPDLLEQIAASLAASPVNVILSGSTNTIHALQEKALKLPIVMAAAEDPVAEGFVQSLSRPGGNITGLSATVLDLVSRQVDLLAGVVPRLAQLAALVNPGHATYKAYVSRLHGALRPGMKLTLLAAKDADDIDDVFVPRSRGDAHGLVVMNDSLFFNERRHIAELAAGVKLPTIYPSRGFVDVGGLMSYGPNPEANFARAASFVDRLLKGAHAAELPIEPPARIELALNREAARVTGVTLPQRLLREASSIR
jgi:putative tryptophan/tyrosine transport system substrate-binding protein